MPPLISGLTLHYRSKRRGFVYYTMGQIREVARHFYHKELQIELVREEVLFDTVHVTFQLTFDNRAFTQASLAMTREEKHLPIGASVLFEIFPFCIVFGCVYRASLHFCYRQTFLFSSHTRIKSIWRCCRDIKHRLVHSFEIHARKMELAISIRFAIFVEGFDASQEALHFCFNEIFSYSEGQRWRILPE